MLAGLQAAGMGAKCTTVLPAGADDGWVEVVNRAFAGSSGTTALHLCFGYGAIVSGKTQHAYPFLPELADSAADQISIEAAQPDLDLTMASQFWLQANQLSRRERL